MTGDSNSEARRPRSLIRLVAGLVVAGIAAGGLWALLAPPIQGVVALARSGERIRGYVGDEADHVFTAAFLMLGFSSVLALVAAALVWKWRSQRGPRLVTALATGVTLASAAAAGVGAALAHWRYGTVDVAGAPVSPEHRVHYVVQAPAVFFGHGPWQIATTILVPTGVAALAVAIAALSNTRDDLGVGVIDPVPTAVAAPVDGP